MPTRMFTFTPVTSRTSLQKHENTAEVSQRSLVHVVFYVASVATGNGQMGGCFNK